MRATVPPRRAAAVLAAVLTVALAVVVAAVGVPFVLYAPGVGVDTLATVAGRQVVSVSGRRTYPTDGSMDLTTVSVTSAGTRLGLAEAITGWVDPSREVLPRSLVYPPAQTAADAQALGRAEMTTSQDSAVLAAARQLGIPVTVTTQVSGVTTGSPAAGRLQAGQEIRTVDGHAVSGAAAVAAAVRAQAPGTTVTIGVTSGSRSSQVPVRLGTAPAGSGVPAGAGYLGVGLAQSERAAVEADIQLGQDIGGPSAGLMFSLAIVDRLTPGTLAGTVHVAGTGTVDDRGTVGPIGGIHQKMLGARAAGATVFLAPSPNCAEAAARPVDGLDLVRVTDLAGAVRALQAAAAGRTAGLPTC